MKTARQLIKEYYADSGEKGTYVRTLERPSAIGTGKDYAYLCHVKTKDGHVPTICVSNNDAYGYSYITEWDHNENEDVLVDSWVHEYDGDSDWCDY